MASPYSRRGRLLVEFVQVDPITEILQQQETLFEIGFVDFGCVNAGATKTSAIRTNGRQSSIGGGASMTT